MTHAPNTSTRARSGMLLSALISPLVAAVLALPMAASAAELLVRITGLSEPLGQLGCSLFAGPAGFPKDSAGARQQWQAADAIAMHR